MVLLSGHSWDTWHCKCINKREGKCSHFAGDRSKHPSLLWLAKQDIFLQALQSADKKQNPELTPCSDWAIWLSVTSDKCSSVHWQLNAVSCQLFEIIQSEKGQVAKCSIHWDYHQDSKVFSMKIESISKHSTALSQACCYKHGQNWVPRADSDVK